MRPKVYGAPSLLKSAKKLVSVMLGIIVYVAQGQGEGKGGRGRAGDLTNGRHLQEIC